jgi:nicotinic acid mononucleotide adenylyltransferase
LPVENVAELLPYRRTLDEMRAEPTSAARLVTDLPGTRNLAVLPGAFNPPTRAHLALARSARDLGFDGVLLSLGSVTVAKPETGLALEDRLALLVRMTEHEPGLGVVVVNRGLYAEQAEAISSAIPGVRDLTFVAGMDKLPQILDPRYYADLEAALAALFARARLLIAARGGEDRDAFERLLADRLGSRFRERIDWLALDPRWRDVSATSIRDALARREDVSQWLPAEITEHLRETGAFADPAAYAERVRALRALRA